MKAVPIRLGIRPRGTITSAPGVNPLQFFNASLAKAQDGKKDNPPPAREEQVFIGQSRDYKNDFSADRNSSYYDPSFAEFINKHSRQGQERVDESELDTTLGVFYWQLEGFDPFPGRRPRRVGEVLDLSSTETKGLGEHPLKKGFDAMRKSLLDETKGLVTALLTTGQAPNDNYAMPFSIEASNYYAQNNIVTDADPFRNETDDPSEGKSNTYAINNIASLDEARQLILHALHSNPRPLTDLVLTTHGDDGEMQIVDANGVGQTVGIESLDAFLASLQNAGVLRPGAQLHLAGCSIANSKASQDILQGLATKYGLRIIANRTLSIWGRPRVSNTMVFYPGTEGGNELVRKYYESKETGVAALNRN
jgi:hypothetical protein